MAGGLEQKRDAAWGRAETHTQRQRHGDTAHDSRARLAVLPGGEGEPRGRSGGEATDASPDRRAPNLLGLLALGLWALAVALGIGAPLLGVAIDSRLVVGVLIASGVVSLLSLPVTVLSSRRTKLPD